MIAIVIVSYNSKEFLDDCLNSVQLACQRVAADVWVVDNAGTDGTAAYVRQNFPWVRVLEAEKNGGFSYGNNLALQEAGFPHNSSYSAALLLNPDTTLEPAALETLAGYLEKNPQVGVVGPKLLLKDGTLDKACKRGEPTLSTTFYHFSGLAKFFPKNQHFGKYNMTFIGDDEMAQVDSVVGACMLVRGSAIRQVGLLDEQFFMYGEDLDWCIRIRNAGWQVVYYPSAVVHHWKGTSSRKQADVMLRAFYDAMTIFYRKHYAPTRSAFTNWLVPTAISLLCSAKLALNSLKPEEQRTVGSAPKQG